MKSSLFALIAAALLVLAVPAAAQEGPLDGEVDNPCLPGAAQDIIAGFLELDVDQLTRWDELIADREAAAQPLREAMAGIQAELEALLSSEDPDPYEVGDLVIQRHDLGGELADVQRTYVEGFDAMLDEEQMDRYHFIRRAERAQPLFVPFRIMDLLPPHWR